MKPKTRIQQEVTRLSKRLPRLTEEQKAYAFRHCFKHYAIKRANGMNICTECGHSWKSGHDLADTICGYTCPHCGMELEVLRTRKSTFCDMEYFSIVTTCKHYQVIRFFSVKSKYKAGQPAEYSICEVVQRWIAPDGKVTTIARLRGMSQLYYDLWNEYSNMEVRKNGEFRAYDIDPVCTYPRQRFISELKRNGFKGEYHNILPYDLFKAILSDSRTETLLKAGQYDLLRYAVRGRKDLTNYWASVKICIRNRYIISDGSLWCDHIDLLRIFGKDTNNPKYVCPQDFNAEHLDLIARYKVQKERKRIAEQQKKAMEDEAKFKELKGRFFGIAFTDGILQIKVLESVHDHLVEGTLMHHCVFSNAYYLKENSLILSATIDRKRIETIEVDLQTLKVVQSRSVCNGISEYHNRIITLVENNANLFRQRMKTA